ncbi:MAG TPA: type VI secretion system baseplate subunit TssF [Verrucomicrobiae bacterium]|jgi:type VI secretion system protein ImpG|nr:type VI secretion system baseplate subunit TssF [Verrucomicrobiae bacterium]
MDERLLELYNVELRHLRQTAAEFGRDFPKIAGRLALDRDAKEVCPDPYVERLLEGFAFLAARVHLKLDAEFPRFTQGLLETVYPDYLCPVPAMGIVKFEPEEHEGGLAPGFVIKRGTPMRSQLGQGERTACTFTTGQDVRLLPLQVVEARYFIRDLAELNLPRELGAKAAFRIRLRKTIPNPFSEIRIDPLVVHIRGADELPGQIYEQIFAHKLKLVIQSRDRNQAPAIFDAEGIRRVGFAPDQALLPAVARGFEGYRLLREHFAFPHRFLFFELAGFQEAVARIEGEEIDIVLALDEPDIRLEGLVEKSCFDLFCAPVINLFEKTLDRVAVSHRFSEFHLVPDRNRPLDYEIYQVTGVTGFGETQDDERRFAPFYQARDTDLDASAFYTVHRAPRLFSDRERLTGRRATYAGTDLFISIVDSDMAPCRTEIKQLGIRALCTNRHLPIQMAKGIGRTDFTMDISAPVNAIRMIQGPTLPRPSLVLAGQNPEKPQVASGRFAWRLVSHLSLNYLSLSDNGKETGAEGLREMLRLYADPTDRQTLKQIDGIRSVSYRPIVRRVEIPGPITFARGLEITVLFDESAFQGQGVFVLGAVLECFFAKYVSLNSFTETVITTQQRKEIMRWPVQMGKKQIL